MATYNIRFILKIAIIIVALAMMVGCSGGSRNPIITSPSQGDKIAETGNLSTPLDGVANGLLGVYQISIDLKSLKSEITPARNLTSIGDIAVPDITQYFISTPCANCFGIEKIGLDSDNNLLITFKMKHPYQDTSKRRDLDVFDIQGIMILPGSATFSTLPFIDIDGDGFVDEAPKGDFNTLLNADGYTYHYDSVAQTLFGLDIEGNLNPYKCFFTENNPDPEMEGNAIPWHKMAQGSPFDKKTYKVKPPSGGGAFSFVFVVECSYGQSALFGIPSGDPGARDNPKYFNPEFNRKEAYSVKISPLTDLTAGDTNSHTMVTSKVEDWQNSQVPGWSLDNPSSIRYRSDVASVTLSIPEISNILYTKTAADTGNGTHLNPYVYSFDVYNNQSAIAGNYTGLLAATDQYQEDGRVLYGATLAIMFANFTNYQAIKFHVVEPGANQPPIAAGSANPNPADHNQTVNLIDTNSSDPDVGDSISLYEWDYIYDGTFTADTSSAQPNQASTKYQNQTGLDIQVTARLRVTDTHLSTNETDVIITVHTEDIHNTPPIAIANANPNPVTSGRPVSFIDILSYDPDPGDSITLYEWDPNIYDGINYEYSSDQPNHTSHVYLNTGLDPIQYTARLRVTDNHNATGTDDVTITVNPNQLPIAVCDATPNPSRGGLNVHFIDHGSYDQDPTGRIIKYEWDFDYDGTTFTPDTSSPSPDMAYHIYDNTSGSDVIYTAALRVTDNALTDDICTVDVTVHTNNPPIAVGSADPNPVYSDNDTTLHAENSSDPDAGDSIVKIEWDYEYDGSTFTADWSSTNLNDTVQHAYHNGTLNPIDITAMLRVSDQGGLHGDKEVVITVKPPIIPPVITHSENKAMNNTGKKYTYKGFNMQSSQISWASGIWDFTTFSTTNTYTEEFINPDSAEFSEYRSDYPAATTVFKTPGDTGMAYAPRYYDDTPNGFQCELGQESSALGPGMGFKFDSPVKIPFPMEMGYSEFKYATGMIQDLLSFSMSFQIDAVGYGLVTTELGTVVCLVTRTILVVTVQGMDDENFVTYEWTADDGRKIATATTQNFDPITYIPLGSIKGARLFSQS